MPLNRAAAATGADDVPRAPLSPSAGNRKPGAAAGRGAPSQLAKAFAVAATPATGAYREFLLAQQASLQKK